MHFADNNPVPQKSPSSRQKSPKSSIKSSKSVEKVPPRSSLSPSSASRKNESAAEAMRKKRDAERREMKKMIAEKRNERIQLMHQEVPGTSNEEVIVLDDKVPTPNGAIEGSPSKVKFQDFLGRDYTPVTSEEDAANLNILKPQLQVDEPHQDKPAGIAAKPVLTSTDDFDLNKRTITNDLNKVNVNEGKVLVSSSCDDLLLSMKNVQVAKPRIEVTTVVEVQEEESDEMDATNHVYEQLDPFVYDQLAEEMGEVWSDDTPGGVGKVEEGMIVEPEDVVVSEEHAEAMEEHAVADFNNMLSAMQEALNLPDRVHNEGDEDEDSTFEEDEDDVEKNRIVGTFGPGDDDDLVAVVESLRNKDDIDDLHSDSESLGSSWGEVEDGERLDGDGEISNYEIVDSEQPHNYSEDEDVPPPSYVSEHDMTVYGVPFPINTDQREIEGLSLHDEDSAACRMEYIREFLEVALGEDKFVQAYRLLKSIDIVDEDSLLEQMEGIVGTEGLKHMEVFIQLITIEEKFENL